MSILFSIFMVQAFASSFSGTDITICRYELPLRVEREVVSIDKGSKEICTIHLDKIKNIYSEKKKVDVVMNYTYKLLDCNIDEKLASFRFVKKIKKDSYAPTAVLSTTISKVSKKFCDEYPPNSIIINHRKR